MFQNYNSSSGLDFTSWLSIFSNYLAVLLHEFKVTSAPQFENYEEVITKKPIAEDIV